MDGSVMQERVYEFVKSYLEGIAPIKASGEEAIMNYRFIDNGHIDSFGIINFIVALEDEFGITLEPKDTESDEFRYVGGIVKIINAKVGS
jgi:acyl carrier protein